MKNELHCCWFWVNQADLCCCQFKVDHAEYTIVDLGLLNVQSGNE